jgi:hypothetical protein
VGFHRNTKPVITEIPIMIGTIIVVFTDGLRHAGSLSGNNCYEQSSVTRALASSIGW